MKFRCSAKPLDDVLDAGPFAAVMFLVLIMLLLHSAIAPAPGVRVQLPEVAAARRSASIGPQLVVTIDQNELVYFEHQVVSEDQLRDKLASKVRAGRQPVQFMLLADDNVRQGAVLRIATLARDCGIGEVIVATREPLFQPKQGGLPPR